jgi:hypothetical protein
MDYITDAKAQHKCAHEQCMCQISTAQEYCSEFCAEADDLDEVELQCACGHPACSID